MKTITNKPRALHICGIGSPFGADKIGWEVVRLLQADANFKNLNAPIAKIHCCDRPGSKLIEIMEHASSLILIDAMCSNQPVGTIVKLSRNQLGTMEKNANLLSSHSFGLAQTIALANALTILPQKTILYAIEIGENGINQELSLSHRNAAQKVCKRIIARLNKHV